MTRKPQTAAELIAELSRDPNFVANKRRRDEEEMQILATLKEEEKPLLSDLESVGVSVGTVWDLVNTRKPYPIAISILTRHLSLPYNLRIKEGIARALTVAYGGSDTLRALMEEFKRQNDNSEVSLKWVLGNAIAACATSADADMLIDLVIDRSNGKARAMIISALPNAVKDRKRLHDILRDLAHDQDVGVFAERAMRAVKRK